MLFFLFFLFYPSVLLHIFRAKLRIDSNSMLLYVHRDRTDYHIRDREPGTATSTFTQLLSSDQSSFVPSVLLYVHRDRSDF